MSSVIGDPSDQGLASQPDPTGKAPMTTAPPSYTITRDTTPDYVSEKLFQPLLAGTVPVYLGAPNVAEFVPCADCFIDAASFESPALLASYLHDLSRNDAEYSKFFSWRKRKLSNEFLELLDGVKSHHFRRLLRSATAILSRRSAN
jgi:hypothetical protein